MALVSEEREKRFTNFRTGHLHGLLPTTLGVNLLMNFDAKSYHERMISPSLTRLEIGAAMPV